MELISMGLSKKFVHALRKTHALNDLDGMDMAFQTKKVRDQIISSNRSNPLNDPALNLFYFRRVTCKK